jgi:hypothetical protein
MFNSKIRVVHSQQQGCWTVLKVIQERVDQEKRLPCMKYKLYEGFVGAAPVEI